ncbi:hypothetical protein DSM3645_11397 [Blastopirellula marina DSM 3645]|uniref:Uncharacterized protein n=1 Tax=Blastopirellula marina DSM 3645 TaxID=314230 RepID=A3ZT21_9BACT|nr:hypothetical protein DSM3645_11397 [Blastopirellula marina DSM 3645]
MSKELAVSGRLAHLPLNRQEPKELEIPTDRVETVIRTNLDGAVNDVGWNQETGAGGNVSSANVGPQRADSAK